MKHRIRRKLSSSVVWWSVLPIALIGAWLLYVSRFNYGLPYHAHFAIDAKDRWTGFGGTWEVADGCMRNDSNDRGAKLLAQPSNWKDYVVEGDLQLLGAGSVGILARVSEAEVGEDSFKGYFAGIRPVDNSLFIGAYDFAYHLVAKVVMPDPVRPFRWYHIRLKVNGCQLTASASAEGMGEVSTAPVNDPDCFRSGTIGLRSNGTGGIWRNISVVPIDSPAVVFASAPLPQSRPAVENSSAGGRTPAIPAPQSIQSLQYLSPLASPLASIRGSVILTRPALFVQDSTGGGVEVQLDKPAAVKIGDEVEVTGEVNLNKFSPVMQNARLRLLREAVPISPSVITANQAATGSYDSRFVQVEGYLQKVSVDQDGTVTLEIDAGPQEFRAILPPGRSKAQVRDLAIQSRLRLRGVSVVDHRFNKAADPFVILVRSAEDVEIIAGPPWWRPSTLIFAILVALGLAFAVNHLYLLAKHWRLQAVADERERLAHEIHDTLAQSFAGIGFQLQAIRNSLPRGAANLEGQVDLAMSMARTSHGEARRNIASLRPKSLDHSGLVLALRECAERMVKNGSVSIQTNGEDNGRSVPPRMRDALYRIGQEAIANAIRHANPSAIRIELQRTRTSICLSVEDDGMGFIADSDHEGFGLLGMRKRAESISAVLTVRSTPGSGTRVEVKAGVGPRLWLGHWLRSPSAAKES